VPNVQWKTPYDRQRNCAKHVEFLDKNKFGKISVFVGFIKKEKNTPSVYCAYEVHRVPVLKPLFVSVAVL
jgi:molybdopterin synthase catalytic subunit